MRILQFGVKRKILLFYLYSNFVSKKIRYLNDVFHLRSNLVTFHSILAFKYISFSAAVL